MMSLVGIIDSVARRRIVSVVLRRVGLGLRDPSMVEGPHAILRRVEGSLTKLCHH